MLWHSGSHRASYFSTRENGKAFEYEDETYLAHGPIRRILSRPEALHCNFEEFRQAWPMLARSALYQPFGHYSLLPLAVEGHILVAASLSVIPTSHGARRNMSVCTPSQIVAVVAEQIQSRVSNNVDYDLLSRERDNFRILVAITNAVLSRLDMDELVSEVSKEIHHYFKIDAISIALRGHRKGKLNIYSTHYLDEANPAHEQSEVDEAGTLSERVFKVRRSCCSISASRM